MIVVIHKTLLNFAVFAQTVDFGTDQVLFHEVVFLVKGVTVRSGLLEEAFIFVGVEESQDHIQACEHDDIDAFMEQLRFRTHFSQSNSCCEDSTT